MRRSRESRSPAFAAAPALVAAGLILASVSVPEESRVAVPALAILGLAATLLLLRAGAGGEYLRDLVLLGIGLRLLLFGAIHQTVGPYGFAPDQFTYEGWGQGLLLHWNGLGPMPRALRGSVEIGYPVLNAVVFYAFGFARAAPAILNIFLSSWIAFPLHRLTLLLTDDERTARWAAALAVLFPSLMLWSVLNIRDAPTVVAVVSAVYFFLRLQRRPDLVGILGLLGTLGLLLTLRDYVTFLVAGAGVAGMVVGRSRSLVASFSVGVLLLLLTTYVAQSTGYADIVVEAPLEQAQMMREGFFFDAGSAYAQDADISTVGGALRFLPVGLAYFLLAPFPWSIGSALQALTLPEILVWYALLPFGLWGAALAVRHRLRRFSVPIVLLAVVTFSYALVEGNVGTAYRHRAQILPLVFVFCALGLRDWLALRRARRDRREQSRRRVRVRTGDSA